MNKITAFGFALLALGAYALEPTFPYRARFTDGNRAIGSLSHITFSLWDEPVGGRELWTRTYESPVANDGVFLVEVGSPSANPTNDVPLSTVILNAKGGTFYLGVAISETNEEARVINPRHALPPVVYAEIVQKATRASGAFAVGGTLSAKAVSVGGTAEFRENANLAGSKPLQVGSLALVGADLSAQRSVRIAGPVIVSNALTVARSLTVGGDYTATADVGRLTTKALKVKGDVFNMSGKPAELPAGIIVPFYGTGAIPSGWHLCDGTNGTPDLRNRFVLGADPNEEETGSGYSLGKTGGTNEVALTLEEIPSHIHLLKGLRWMGWNGINDSGKNALNTGSSQTVTTDSTGSGEMGQAHENRPPYMTVRFIMKAK